MKKFVPNENFEVWQVEKRKGFYLQESQMKANVQGKGQVRRGQMNFPLKIELRIQ